MPSMNLSLFGRLARHIFLTAGLMAFLTACGGGGSVGEAPTPATAVSPIQPPTPVAPITPAPPITPVTPVTPVLPPPIDQPQPVAACGRDNPRVGQVATLTTRAHGVSGKARVLDNCTIEITMLNYDGGGLPDVFFYGGLNGNYRAGFAFDSNFYGRPQSNTTVKLTLKEGDLNNMNGISLWCVRAGVSFGDGLFAQALTTQ